MPCRKISILVAVALLAALIARASDFWLGKDWHKWSLTECNQMLTDSPWVHVWKVPRLVHKPTNDTPPTGQIVPNTARSKPPDMELQADRSEAGYEVQLKSALPVREAIARRTQLNQHYDKMAAADRGPLEFQTERLLNGDHEDEIHIHVHLSTGNLNAGPERIDIPDFLRPGVENLHAILVTEDGTRIKPSRVALDSKTLYSFDAFFPRITNGAPTIKAGQKRFTFQFETPESVDTQGAFGVTRHIAVKFDLAKMVVGGKTIY